MEVVENIIALAQLAYETCENAKQCQEECIRIGDRLMNLIVLTKEWTDKTAAGKNNSKMPSISALRSLKKVLTRLNLALQAATTEKKHWSRKVIKFMQSGDRKEAILKSEKELNSVLQDFQVQQHTALYKQNEAMFKDLKNFQNQVD